MSDGDFKQVVIAGRDLANELMETQLLKSTKPTLRNNMAVLQIASTHILSSLIFHQIRAAPNETVDQHLEKIIWGIRNELEYMKEARAAGAFSFRPIGEDGEPN